MPVAPHKAVMEVSKIGNQTYRRGELLRCMDGRVNPLMGRKVVGAVLFGVVAVVTGCTPAGCSCSCRCSVVYCSAAQRNAVQCSVSVGVVVVEV